ncbi:hypothetical protein CIL05_07145 [Virgibacillus profundi]|uniref:Uncharacterized protein n=1 Tax=Virgibacillus profundi TaxID=2024555 RepID=A0A2A2IFZ5_9BACI|nr:hypothetical protein [Virgibacillus profundi]PAV30236.1 hypothetical protein CIL05_07145 [Virgibacillus profundi]PXY54408.1 hypothetical protein CIT14_07230 [Virgibacillus profundi]
MEKVIIKIKTENAAFEEVGVGNELARILKDMADQLEDAYNFPKTLMDLNGNKVGTVEYE